MERGLPLWRDRFQSGSGRQGWFQSDLLIREFAFGWSDESSTRQLVINPDPIPEPGTALLLGLGLVLTGWRRRSV